MPYTSWNIQHHPAVRSTNQLALETIHRFWQLNKSPHALVITAEQQSAGRGQHGRTWLSPEGGLYLSAILEHIPPAIRDKLALLAGVATAKALRNFLQIKISLRWPNDIMLDGKKLGGILCEATSQAQGWAGVIGIGLNINTHLGELPKPLQRTANSLLHHLGEPQNIPAIQKVLLTELAAILDEVSSEGLTPIVAAARQMDSLRGHTVQLQDSGRLLTGTAAGIGDSGELLLQTESAIEPLTTATLFTIDGVAIR